MPYRNLADARAAYQRKRKNPKWLAKQRDYMRKYMKIWRVTNPDRIRYERDWARAHRRKVRGEKFGKRRRKKTDAEILATKRANRRRYYERNRERINAAIRAKRLADPERFRRVDRARYIRDPEKRRHASLAQRAKRTGEPFYLSIENWQSLLAERSYRCFYCHVGLTIRNRSLDHKIPLVRGGTNDRENLVPACRSCNQRKNRKTESEFEILTS